MQRDDEGNPKDIVATSESRVGIAHLPTCAVFQAGVVMRLGAEKYWSYNWRDAGARASVYYDAAFRHLAAWYEGESDDPESRVSHLAHVIACAAILIDAEKAGALIDDRPEINVAPHDEKLREALRAMLSDLSRRRADTRNREG